MTRGRRGTKKVGHTVRPTHACSPCTRWRFELSAFLTVCRSLQLVQLWAWCNSTRISHRQKLSKNRVVLNVDLRSLSRGGKTSPCLRTGFTACAAVRRMR